MVFLLFIYIYESKNIKLFNMFSIKLNNNLTCICIVIRMVNAY